MKTHLYVISHTHWDREWYMSFEKFRLKLVDLIDHCLVILKENPDYIFHLDAQTVVLEDYLQIRTGKEAVLKKYIRQGRLVIGPWYLQNDFYLTSGEATIRNLLYGKELCRRFGGYSHIGYAPDQFGNISQLPQILNNFAIDNFIFGRGISRYNQLPGGRMEAIPMPSEFEWIGADGSSVLAIHMKYWYNNAQRFSEDIRKSAIMITTAMKSFQGIATTPYILLMNGVDHLEAQENLLPILNKLNEISDGTYDIRQASMAEYVEKVKEAISANPVKPTAISGEMRSGQDGELLKGTLSTAIHLKQQNVLLQNRIENQLEPAYAMLEYSGATNIFPKDELVYAWKTLMKNHPHDSICCCSRNEIMKNMQDRFMNVQEITGMLLSRAVGTITDHVALFEQKEENYVISITNTTELLRSGEMAEAVVDLPGNDKEGGFGLFDERGEPVPYEIVRFSMAKKDIFTPINLPGVIDVARYEIRFIASCIKPFSSIGYVVKPNSRALLMKQEQPALPNVMENEYLKITIGYTGKIDILSKTSGTEIKDAIDFEETADRGDSYIYLKTDDKTNHSSEFPAAITLVENSPLAASYKITRTMVIPADYDFASRRRSAEMASCEISLMLTLYKGSPVLHVGYDICNKARYHRIRLVVKTQIRTASTTADIPFDVVAHDDGFHCQNTMSKVLPNTSFALLENGVAGVAVFTAGQHEYEHIQDETALAFTVVRSTGVIGRDGGTLEMSGGEGWHCEDNQCLTGLSGEIGILPYEGTYLDAGIPGLAKKFRTKLLVGFNSCDKRKFMGGRTAVQDSRVSELFYRKDPYETLRLSDESILTVDNKNIAVTAFKLAENSRNLIVRMWNVSGSSQSARISVNGTIRKVMMNEDPIENLGRDEIIYSFNKKEILTLEIRQ